MTARAHLSLVLVLSVAAAVLPSRTSAQQHVAPVDAPSRATLVQRSEPGVAVTVHGRVLDQSDRPVPGASIYVYQTDSTGEYVKGLRGGGSDRPRLFAYLRSDANGSYSFTTIRPGSYPGTQNPGHIHFEILTNQGASRVYEIVFANDPLIPEGFRAQARNPLGGVAIVEATNATGGALDVKHDIRVPSNR